MEWACSSHGLMGCERPPHSPSLHRTAGPASGGFTWPCVTHGRADRSRGNRRQGLKSCHTEKCIMSHGNDALESDLHVRLPKVPKSHGPWNWLREVGVRAARHRPCQGCAQVPAQAQLRPSGSSLRTLHSNLWDDHSPPHLLSPLPQSSKCLKASSLRRSLILRV